MTMISQPFISSYKGLAPFGSLLPFLSLHARGPGSSIAIVETYLCEPDILTLFPEALTADIEAVFSDETGFVGADATVW